MSTDEERKRTADFVKSAASFWSDISPAHSAGDYLAGQLAETREGFVALRGQMAFEEEPSSFVAALLDTRETGS